jgi:hypothetical protein
VLSFGGVLRAFVLRARYPCKIVRKITNLSCFMNATNVAKWRRYYASLCVISKVYTLGGVKYQLRLTKCFRAICAKNKSGLAANSVVQSVAASPLAMAWCAEI